MGTRGGETQDTERQSLTLLPPPERCVPHRTLSNGEGGWAPGGLHGTGGRYTGLQSSARSGSHGGSGDSGGHGGSGDSGGHGGSGSLGGHGGSGDSGGHGGTTSETAAPAPPRSRRPEPYYPPPPNFLGEIRGYIGHLGRTGGADSWGHSGSVDTWGRSRGAGSGVRWLGAGSGVRWLGAGSGVPTGGHL